MTATETILKTTTGLVQYFESEDALLQHYNRSGRVYEIRPTEAGRVLWHKGHAYATGVVEVVAARA